MTAAPIPRSAPRRRKLARNVVRTVANPVNGLLPGLILIWILFPFLWMVLSSFRPQEDIQTPDISILPHKLTAQYYDALISDPTFRDAFFNSLIVASVVTVVTVTLGILGAYALTRMRLRFARALYRGLMLAYMLPAVALLVPAVTLFKQLGLLDTLTGMVLAHLAFTLPLVTWFLVGAFLEFPGELEEAARLDGYTQFGALRKVVVPVTLRIGGLAAVFAFVLSWNELLLSSALSAQNVQMIEPRILQLLDPFGRIYPLLFAGGVLASVPVLIVAFAFQRYILRELSHR